MSDLCANQVKLCYFTGSKLLSFDTVICLCFRVYYMHLLVDFSINCYFVCHWKRWVQYSQYKVRSSTKDLLYHSQMMKSHKQWLRETIVKTCSKLTAVKKLSQEWQTNSTVSSKPLPKNDEIGPPKASMSCKELKKTGTEQRRMPEMSTKRAPLLN